MIIYAALATALVTLLAASAAWVRARPNDTLYQDILHTWYTFFHALDQIIVYTIYGTFAGIVISGAIITVITIALLLIVTVAASLALIAATALITTPVVLPKYLCYKLLHRAGKDDLNQ